MEEIKLQRRQSLTPHQSWSSIVHFSKSIAGTCTDRFADKGEAANTFHTCLAQEHESFEIWKNNYTMIRGKSLQNNLLPQEEILTSMIELCSLYTYKLNKEFEEIIKFFYLMRYSANEYRREGELFEAAIDRALEGETS